MNKTLKWILIGVLTCVILYFGISFFAVSWLSYFSNPKRIENVQEKKVLEKIKTKYNIQEIERTPEYEKDIIEKDTATYTLYLYSKNFCEIKTDSVKESSMQIAKEINQIDLDPKFYKYKLVFCCKLYNPNGISFQYVRKDL